MRFRVIAVWLLLFIVPASAISQITLHVDASEAARKILHARMTIPAKPGALTLVYPKWIPGEHGPTGPIIDLAGLKFTAAGKPLEWQRDPADMYAILLQVPQGVNEVEGKLDFLLPAAGAFSGGVSATSQMAVISWNQVLLYPKDSASDAVRFTADLKLPAGWKFGTALPVAGQTGETISFNTVSLTTLVDSPVIAGAHFREVPITPEGESRRHFVELASDSDAALAVPNEVIGNYKRLVAETGALFGARHYNEYRFLISLSDNVAHFGLEHHESSDDRISERSLVDDDLRKLSADLLPHEMAHSWNGKYRRPAGLATANYQDPMKGDLLWVYEGLTTYLGNLLAARSGLATPEEYREGLASNAAYLDLYPGRTWRPLSDTTGAAQLLYGSPAQWRNWRRSVDFYDEGNLIWLEADTIIRQQSNGAKSLDDFTRLFHGGKSGPPAVNPYTLDDVIAALNQVTPYDWKTFLHDRVYAINPRAPMGGIENSGWRLAFTDKQPPLDKIRERERKFVDFSYSLGLNMREDGNVVDVVIGGPSDKAGLAPGMKLVAVNRRAFSKDLLRETLTAARNSSEPIELLATNDDFFRAYRIDYHGGNRYPVLERDASRPDLLTAIIAPHAGK